MKKRINGRKYNTDTAIYVGQYTLDTDQAWNAYTETLYYKRNGEFFLFRHGGRREDFQENQNPPVNPEWPIQIEFEPLTFEQAKEWARRYFTRSKFLELFVDVEYDNGKYSLISLDAINKRIQKLYS